MIEHSFNTRDDPPCPSIERSFIDLWPTSGYNPSKRVEFGGAMVESRRRRTEAPEVRRSQILEAAKVCFRKVGFHSTKMAEVARTAGVSVGLVYQYFSSKEELIEAIILEDVHKQMHELTAILDSEHAPVSQSLGSVLVRRLRPVILDQDRMALMLEVAAETMRNEKIRSVVEDVQARTAKDLRARLSQKIRTGANLEEAEARLRLVSGLITGAAIQLYGHPESEADLILGLLEQTVKDILAPL